MKPIRKGKAIAKKPELSFNTRQVLNIQRQITKIHETAAKRGGDLTPSEKLLISSLNEQIKLLQRFP